MSEARTPRAGSLNLSENELRFVAAKWRKIRESQQTADQANNDWKRIGAEIRDYLDRSGIHEMLARAKVMQESLALADALEVGDLHARTAQRHIDDLRLFLVLKEHGLL